MQSASRLANRGAAILGVIAAVAMLLSYAPLEFLRPKMVAFEPLSASEEGLINYVGIALLLALAFCVLAIALLIRYIWTSQRLSLFHLVVIAGGVLAPLFIFADIALLSDIGKQYELGLSQPEWTMLYLVLGAQFLAIACLLYAVVFTLDGREDLPNFTRDSCLFLIVHYVGALCGMLGFAFTLVNFLYPRPLWMIQKQFLPTLIVMLTPYVLMVVLWIVGTSRSGGLLDEKQRRDSGASSFVATAVSLIGMTALYVVSFMSESGIVNVLWFPFYLFLLLSVFSLSNLYLARDNLRLPE